LDPNFLKALHILRFPISYSRSTSFSFKRYCKVWWNHRDRCKTPGDPNFLYEVCPCFISL